MKNDLHGFLELLQHECPQDLVRIAEPVGLDREPHALLQNMEAQGRSPVLWFERPGASTLPLVVNIHGTLERLALALGVLPHEVNRVYGARLQHLIAPVMADHAPVQEIVRHGEDVDLSTLPLVTPSDNCLAPYIGGGIVVAKDPISNVRNLSYNRLMLRGRNRFTFHAAPGQHLATILKNAEAREEELPVAIIIGCHPALGLGALAKVPFEIDEYSCAGALLQEPLPLVKCLTLDLEVPAHAEIVLEGRVLLGAQDWEGPYDEFTGYAMPQEMQPIIEISAITHRENAIYQDVFGSSREHLLMGAIPKEASLLARLKGLHPAVTDVHYPLSGCGRLHAVVALGAHRTPEARRVLLSAFALDHFLKHVWVVDDDVDIRSDREVLWSQATCFQADHDMIVLEKMLGSSLDPSADEGAIAAKAGFECTRKKPDFPPRNSIAPEILDKMNPARFFPNPPS